VDVRDWYTTQLRRAPFVIAIVGAVDADAMARHAAQAFAELAMAERAIVPAPVWPSHSEQNVESRDKAQTALAVAFPGPTRQDPTRFSARMVSTIASGLGGRFFDELRDRQSLAYTVHAFASELSHAGLFISYIATSPDREAVARDGLLREFAKLRDEPVTNVELANAKRYLTGMHDIRQERGGSVLADVVDAWLFGTSLRELDQFVANVQAVSADDILALARTYFDPDRRVEGIVRGVGRTV
jgi:zinc protease